MNEVKAPPHDGTPRSRPLQRLDDHVVRLAVFIDRLGDGAGALALRRDLEIRGALDADLVPNV